MFLHYSVHQSIEIILYAVLKTEMDLSDSTHVLFNHVSSLHSVDVRAATVAHAPRARPRACALLVDAGETGAASEAGAADKGLHLRGRIHRRSGMMSSIRTWNMTVAYIKSQKCRPCRKRVNQSISLFSGMHLICYKLV